MPSVPQNLAPWRPFEARYNVDGTVSIARVMAGDAREVWLTVKSLYPTAVVTAIMALTI